MEVVTDELRGLCENVLTDASKRLQELLLEETSNVRRHIEEDISELEAVIVERYGTLKCL